MNRKFKAFFLGAPAVAAYIISFNRDEYVRTVVHRQCNERIAGFFNKTATSSGWKCSQGGEVMHTVSVKASLIPSPLEISAVIGICLVLFFLVRWVVKTDFIEANLLYEGLELCKEAVS